MAAAGYQSKILDAAARRRGLGSFGDLGPGALALGEWQALGLELPDLAALRAYRLARVRAQLAARDCAGIVVTDPINIRYTTDAANMQVWCLHNAARYAFVATEGPIVLFDFHGCAHLAEPLPLVDEVRPARAWYYFHSGPRLAEHAGLWAAELADLVRAHGGGNRRLAIDKADRAGVPAKSGRAASRPRPQCSRNSAVASSPASRRPCGAGRSGRARTADREASASAAACARRRS